QLGIRLLQLPHLAFGAPAPIAVTRVAPIGVGRRVEAAGGIEPRRQLVGQALALDEVTFAREPDRVFVEVFCLQRSSVDTTGFRGCQRVFVAEGGRPVFRPFL